MTEHGGSTADVRALEQQLGKAKRVKALSLAPALRRVLVRSYIFGALAVIGIPLSVAGDAPAAFILIGLVPYLLVLLSGLGILVPARALRYEVLPGRLKLAAGTWMLHVAVSALAFLAALTAPNLVGAAMMVVPIFIGSMQLRDLRRAAQTEVPALLGGPVEPSPG